MKLYNTTTSERASKGQGGNKQIISQFFAETKAGNELIAEVELKNNEGKYELYYTNIVKGLHRKKRKLRKGNLKK